MLNKKNVGGINDLHQFIIPDQKFDVKTKARMPPSPDLPNLIMRNFYLMDFESFFFVITLPYQYAIFLFLYAARNCLPHNR
jgi:hypothetical protein